MDELIRLLNEFGADQDLIDRVTAFAQPAEGDQPSGAEAMEYDDLTELVNGLRALADDETSSAALLGEVADGIDAVNAEVSRRDEEAEAEEAERQAAIARIRGENADDEGEEETEDPNEGTEGEPEGGEEGEQPEETEAVENEPEPVTAAQPRSARRAPRRSLARRRPRDAAPVEAADEGPRIVFNADIPGHPVGSAGTMADVNRALLQRYSTFARSARGRKGRGSEQQIPVATIHREFPQERSLVDEQGRMLAPHVAAARVQAAINEALANYRSQGQAALTAAGGLCAPLQPIYTVETLGEQSRPIRDGALVSFQGARGGVVSVAPPSLAQIGAQDPNSVGVWTMEDDEASLEPGTVKSCARIVCNPQRETEIYAITKCVIIGNVIARTFTEYVDAWGELVMVHQDRTAESRLFTLIQNNAITNNHSTATTVLSATRDILVLLDQVAWNLRSRHRLGQNFPFRVILPDILRGIMRSDLARALAGGSFAENLNVADAAIASYFMSRNLLVTWSPDLVVQDPITDGNPVPDWPATVPYALYPEGTFLHLDAGELDLGVVRDSTLNETNDYEIFAETFEAVHGLGTEAVAGNVQVCPTGAQSGTEDLSDICPVVS